MQLYWNSTFETFEIMAYIKGTDSTQRITG